MSSDTKPAAPSNIFTQIIQRKIPANIRYEDDLCIAFDDINPQSPVHVLLIPKKMIAGHNHVETKDLTLMGHLIIKAKEIAQKMGLNQGWRLVINEGKEGAQTVPHLHIHILGGRAMKWPPG